MNSNENNKFVQFHQLPKPLQDLINIRKDTIKCLGKLMDNLRNGVYTCGNSMYWNFFKSNVEVLEKYVGEDKYNELLKPLYANKSNIEKEYTFFVYTRDKYQKDPIFLEDIQKVDYELVTSYCSSIHTSTTSLSAKRNHGEIISSDESEKKPEKKAKKEEKATTTKKN